MADITLSNGVRSSLLQLQRTADLTAQTQEKLSTGKRVNSALDNPVNFFTAASLNSRAGAISGLLDGLSNSIKTIEGANNGLEGIKKLVETAQSSIKQALSNTASKTKPQAFKALATTAESAATGKSMRETALDKLAVGTAADASSSSVGNAGIVATGQTTINLSVGDTTNRITVSATTTVRDLVASVNASGLATASVDDTGKLVVTANDSRTLKITDDAATPVAAGLFAGTSGTTALPAGGVASTGISSETRSRLSTQFNELRSQIGKLARDSGFNGINLLDGDKLTVTFNEKTGSDKATLEIQGSKLGADALGILAASATETDFQSDADLNEASASLTTALSSLETRQSELGSSLAILRTRQDFSESTIETLKSGAANLTLADTNEEAAKLLSLQTRQQLSSTALSLANQADQAVLRLF